ncbi:MAG: hypothetical protein C0436_00130 [Alphaproteobacteria bacterium]|nr:hypothetical protein [Alphaproteobacteria bacterium]
MRLKLFSLALSLFCFTYAASAQGYWITEAELTQLETALTTAQSELRLSQVELTKLEAIIATQETRLEKLASISSEQAAQLTTLSGLFSEYENAAQRTRAALVVAVVATSLVSLGLGLVIVFK